MKTLLFGYGSLINLESVSRTLKRELSKMDVLTGLLNEFERSWTVWDDVMSANLNKQVKAAFLNVISKPGAVLNGIFIEVSNDELAFLKIREKNYNCINITKQVTFDKPTFLSFQAFTFSGKQEFFIEEETHSCFIFERYQEIIKLGIKVFGEHFSKKFMETTVPSPLKILPGKYSFIDPLQQNII